MTFRMMDGRFMPEKTEITGALAAVKAADAVEYAAQGINGTKVYAVDGNSIKESLPRAVCVDGLGMAQVELESLVPVLFAAVKELSARVEALEAKKTTTRSRKAA